MPASRIRAPNLNAKIAATALRQMALTVKLAGTPYQIMTSKGHGFHNPDTIYYPGLDGDYSACGPLLWCPGGDRRVTGIRDWLFNCKDPPMITLDVS
jgi:hypothetical protein